ncbi:hypothetical protein [endosymbiont GvMRE of Glomus versiforme]|uniref:hypothetical protein n=1 Tax=endosymbiont GvMRE of Glomus versiforme TaxID=2039283 RepID=UPI000EC1E8A9|nr:hypothetical protein [endosymbiont GvMRE of Glomus versiforme]RHZ37330.1 hypothetical protein GvMRE_I1g111 [endosymbiont GvMRE of Glomus versiforme]
MVSSSPTQFKKESRKFKIEVEIKDKKNGQITKLTKEEEIELEFNDGSPHSHRKPVEKEKIIKINQNGKNYNLNFTVERVRKGWLKDTPLNYSVKSMTDDFVVISQKVTCPQWRSGGFIAIGVAVLLLIGGMLAFIFQRKRKTSSAS